MCVSNKKGLSLTLGLYCKYVICKNPPSVYYFLTCLTSLLKSITSLFSQPFGSWFAIVCTTLREKIQRLLRVSYQKRLNITIRCPTNLRNGCFRRDSFHVNPTTTPPRPVSCSILYSNVSFPLSSTFPVFYSYSTRTCVSSFLPSTSTPVSQSFRSRTTELQIHIVSPLGSNPPSLFVRGTKSSKFIISNKRTSKEFEWPPIVSLSTKQRL